MARWIRNMQNLHGCVRTDGKMTVGNRGRIPRGVYSPRGYELVMFDAGRNNGPAFNRDSGWLHREFVDGDLSGNERAIGRPGRPHREAGKERGGYGRALVIVSRISRPDAQLLPRPGGGWPGRFITTARGGAEAVIHWLHRLIHRKPKPVPPSPALIQAEQATEEMHRASTKIAQAINHLERRDQRSDDLSIDSGMFPDWPPYPPRHKGTEYD